MKPGLGERLRSATSGRRSASLLVLGGLGVVGLAIAFFWNAAIGKELTVADETLQALSQKRGVPLSADAMQVAERWILGAVTRDDLAGTFVLTDPDIRGAMTREEWESGEIPVVPYPVGELTPQRWSVTYSVTDEALLEIPLEPASNATKVAALTFILGLKRVGTGTARRWVVNYWSPKYRAEVPLTR
jgi:hypothetical protein